MGLASSTSRPADDLVCNELRAVVGTMASNMWLSYLLLPTTSPSGPFGTIFLAGPRVVSIFDRALY